MHSTVQAPFNIFKTLYVIENNKSLNKIFLEYTPNLSYNIIKTMANNNKLESEILERARDIFENIIRQDDKMLIKYQTFNTLKVKPSKYYGKKRVLQDLKNNPKSEVDSALLALNDLRNTLAKLRTRCAKDKLHDKKILNSRDYRDIVASVRLLQTRVKPILLKKIHHDTSR